MTIYFNIGMRGQAGVCPIFEDWQCYGNRQIPIHDNMRIHDLKPLLSVKDGGLTDEEFCQWDTNRACVTLKSVEVHSEIKVKSSIPWTKAMINGSEDEALDDEFGKYIRLKLNADIDVTVEFTLSDRRDV